MSARTIKLLGPKGDLLATAQVNWKETFFSGTINLSMMPLPLLRTFEEFEELVNGQNFSLLDDIEQRIGDLGIKVDFDDGRVAEVEDLQIYPSTCLISFKVETLARLR